MWLQSKNFISKMLRYLVWVLCFLTAKNCYSVEKKQDQNTQSSYDTLSSRVNGSCWEISLHRSLAFLPILRPEALSAFVLNYSFKDVCVVSGLKILWYLGREGEAIDLEVGNKHDIQIVKKGVQVGNLVEILLSDIIRTIIWLIKKTPKSGS